MNILDEMLRGEFTDRQRKLHERLYEALFGEIPPGVKFKQDGYPLFPHDDRPETIDYIRWAKTIWKWLHQRDSATIYTCKRFLGGRETRETANGAIEAWMTGE